MYLNMFDIMGDECIKIKCDNKLEQFSDMVFLTTLTSSVWIISEVKKLVERVLEQRGKGKRSPLEYV